MYLNKNIIDFKDPKIKKQVDRIHYEREMILISTLLFCEKLIKKLNLMKQ